MTQPEDKGMLPILSIYVMKSIPLKSWAVFILVFQAGLTEVNSCNLDRLFISLSITLFISLQLILVKAENFISFKLVSGSWEDLNVAT